MPHIELVWTLPSGEEPGRGGRIEAGDQVRTRSQRGGVNIVKTLRIGHVRRTDQGYYSCHGLAPGTYPLVEGPARRYLLGMVLPHEGFAYIGEPE